MKKAERQFNPNSFDLLRLCAATTVMVCHQFLVLKRPEPTFGVKGLGFFAVLVFFGLSGGLITQSWERDPRAKSFLLKRCLRIFPALLLVVSMSALIIGPLFTNKGLHEYFLDSNTWAYFRCVLLWPFHSRLPGVFESNPYPSAVNASLWTLSIEFGLYLTVLLAGELGLLSRKYWVSVIMLLFSGVAAVGSFRRNPMVFDITLLSFMFWWGAWMRIHLQSGRPLDKTNGMMGVCAVVILVVTGPHAVLRTCLVFFASALVWLASRSPFGDRVTRPIGDLSYGVYIFAFPVQQSLVAAFGMSAFPYWEYLVMSCAITFTLALVSWHLVEKRCIRLKTAWFRPPAKDLKSSPG